MVDLRRFAYVGPWLASTCFDFYNLHDTIYMIDVVESERFFSGYMQWKLQLKLLLVSCVLDNEII